jgi:uncharacterized protein YuzE
MKLKIDNNGKVRLNGFDHLWLRLEVTVGKFFLAFHRYEWRAYDPTWLVNLARAQFPNDRELQVALQGCTSASGDIPYIYFVNPRRANKPGSEWQFARNVTLDDPKKGELILDILKDGRVGGVEFLGVLLSAS